MQKKVRCHNRQIHKAKTLKGGVRKANQSPYKTRGFRLFDKVKIRDSGQVGFIFGSRQRGDFDVRTIERADQKERELQEAEIP